MAHITGGGLLENIPRSLPDSLAASIELGTWPLPPVFAWLAKTGRLDTRELARTFNCGIGMVLVTAPSNAQHVLDSMARAGEVCYAIGTLMPRGETVRAGCRVARPARRSLRGWEGMHLGARGVSRCTCGHLLRPSCTAHALPPHSKCVRSNVYALHACCARAFCTRAPCRPPQPVVLNNKDAWGLN